MSVTSVIEALISKTCVTMWNFWRIRQPLQLLIINKINQQSIENNFKRRPINCETSCMTFVALDARKEIVIRLNKTYNICSIFNTATYLIIFLVNQLSFQRKVAYREQNNYQRQFIFTKINNKLILIFKTVHYSSGKWYMNFTII